MKVLVTNDDGVDSPGLHALALMLHQEGHEVVVAAPSAQASGSSAAITGSEEDGRVRVERREIPVLPGIPVYAVAATPGYIALIATRGAFEGPPDLICSGINHGANVGRSVIHSGTVGAVLTGLTYGFSGLAVSLDIRLHSPDDPHWTVAAQIAAEQLPFLLGSAEPVALNVNVPDQPREAVLGVREAHLASFGAVQTQFEAGEGFVRMTISETGSKLEEGTDAAVLADGYASVTALQAITEAPVGLLLRKPGS